VDPRLDRQRLIEGGAQVVSWTDWAGTETPGVGGDVVWDEQEQSGYMRFVGLPANDPSKEQYQLWIIDRRGMEQRVSGGVFNSDGGEVVVPIEPGLAIEGAGAFAVTIEEPGGVAVSDMSRKSVIAQL
jgi:anti-sigma-K factor RskA